MNPSLPFTPADLCAHGDALRRLAHALLSDGELARDVVQEAYAKAIERPPSSGAALRAWLEQVVRRCASDTRRARRSRMAREQFAARPEATAADAAESLAVQHEILAAVRELREPYRTAVWLRYYEDLAPAAIAVRLGEPVKTVKTRLWRALRMLREGLDGPEQQRDWRAALLPLALASPDGRAVGAAWAIGAWIMQLTKTSLALAGVLLAAGLWLLWSGVGAAGVDPGVPGVAPEAGPNEPVTASQATSTEREATGSAPAATQPDTDPYGSLLVRAVWNDGAPASGVAILFEAQGEPALDRNDLRVVTDAAGVARASRLHAGSVRLSCEHGGELMAQVYAGGEAEALLTIPRGIDVTGVVEDATGQPVPAARIWLANGKVGWLGGRVVTAAGSDGRFALRRVDRRHSLGALADGFAPSALVDLEDVATKWSAVEVRLQLLGKGAAVTGQVLDERGQPVHGALVAVGKTGVEHPSAAGHRSERWTPEVVASDTTGRFRCDGVEPGAIPIEVRAEGFALWSDEVTARPGDTKDVIVTLARGVLVHGTVTDEQTNAVPGATVAALPKPLPKAFLPIPLRGNRDDSRAFARPKTQSDAQGRYRLECVSPGDLHLMAGKWDRGPTCQGACQQTLPGRSGDDLLWNPVLSIGLTIRGRVVDAEGKSYSHTILEATPDTPAEGAELMFAYVRDGRFEFTQCVDVPYTIAPQAITRPRGVGWVYRSGVRPGGPEIVLTIPKEPRRESGSVHGRVIDSGHRVREATDIRVALLGDGWRTAQVTGDRFTLDGLPPGRYCTMVQAKEEVVLAGAWFDLAPGQRLDVGDLVTQPGGALTVTLRAPPGVALGSPSAYACFGREERSLAWDGRRLHADNLTAGNCRLSFWSGVAGTWHARPRDVTVVTGQETEIEVDVAPAVFRKIELTFPPPDQWHEGHALLRDARGAVVAESTYHADSVGLRPMSLSGPQPLGTFTLEVTTDGGHQKSWPVDLTDPATASRVLRFSLR